MSREDTVRLLHACADCLSRRRDAMEEVLIEVQDPDLRRQICCCMDIQQSLKWQTEHLLQQCGESAPELHPATLLQGRIRVRLRMTLQPSGASAAELLTDGSRRTVRRLNREQNRTPDAAVPARVLVESVLRSEQILTDAVKSYL